MAELERMVLVGIGSNLDPVRNIAAAFAGMQRCFGDVAVSTLYLTRPLHGRHQQPYVNGVIRATTVLSATAVREALAAIETACGRTRTPGDAYASRTLDLDLLVLDGVTDGEQNLPATDLLTRDFVLVPAAELAPDWVHPSVQTPLAALAPGLFPDGVSAIARLRFDPGPPAVLGAVSEDTPTLLRPHWTGSG